MSAKLWQALLDWLKLAWPSIVGALKLLAAGQVGRSLQQGRDAKQALKDVESAGRAGADMRSRSFDEQVQFLQRRGRVRNLRDE